MKWLVNGASGRRASLTRACRSVASCFSDSEISRPFLVRVLSRLPLPRLPSGSPASRIRVACPVPLLSPHRHVVVVFCTRRPPGMLLLIHSFLFVWCARHLRPPAVAVAVAIRHPLPVDLHFSYTIHVFESATPPHVHVLLRPRAIQLRLAVAATVVYRENIIILYCV